MKRNSLILLILSVLLSFSAFSLSVSGQPTDQPFRIYFYGLTLANYSSVFNPAFGNFNSTLRNELAALGGSSGWSATYFSVVNVRPVSPALGDSAGYRTSNAIAVEILILLANPAFTATYLFSQIQRVCCSAAGCDSFGFCNSNNPALVNAVALAYSAAFIGRCCDGVYLADLSQCNKCENSHWNYLPIMLGLVITTVGCILLWLLYRYLAERHKKQQTLKPLTIGPQSRLQPPPDSFNSDTHTSKPLQHSAHQIHHAVTAKPGNIQPPLHSHVHSHAHEKRGPAVPAEYENQLQFKPVSKLSQYHNGTRRSLPSQQESAASSAASASATVANNSPPPNSQNRQIAVTRVIRESHPTDEITHTSHHSHSHHAHAQTQIPANGRKQNEFFIPG